MFSKTKKGHQRTNGKIQKREIKTAKRSQLERRSLEGINPLSGTNRGESPPESWSTPSPNGTDRILHWASIAWPA